MDVPNKFCTRFCDCKREGMSCFYNDFMCRMAVVIVFVHPFIIIIIQPVKFIKKMKLNLNHASHDFKRMRWETSLTRNNSSECIALFILEFEVCNTSQSSKNGLLYQFNWETDCVSGFFFLK